MNININKLLFIDIQTVAEEIGIDGLSEKKRRVWTSLLDVFEKRILDPVKLEEVYKGGEASHDALYRFTAGLYPEFGKVCCVSMAFVTDAGETKFESVNGEDEKSILRKTREILNKVNKLGFSVCGQNIKNFDIPFLGKRFLMNGLKPPTIFPTHDTKPWDIKVVDIKDVWSFGGRYGLSSLDPILTSLNIESDDIDGQDIGDYFWEGEHDTIKEHSENTVQTYINIISKINNLK